MPERAMIGLDNPVFNGRLRRPEGAAWSFPDVSDTAFREPIQAEIPQEASMAEPVRQIEPDLDKQPEPIAVSEIQRASSPRSRRILFAMAGIVFVAGLAVSIQGSLTNHAASAHVSALVSSGANHSDGGGAPSTTRPSAKAFSQYAVAPDLPRYLKIPKLGVNTRVMQVGVTSSGALATPSNVYDSAWYTGSAKPGEQGATLIDGHVSSWTTKGVFYGIKNLEAGDRIQIVRGDDTVLTYSVVKTQSYDADNVDMKAAIKPVTQGKSGLNLITCSGKVKPGTSEFTQRTIVFAEQV